MWDSVMNHPPSRYRRTRPEPGCQQPSSPQRNETASGASEFVGSSRGDPTPSSEPLTGPDYSWRTRRRVLHRGQEFVDTLVDTGEGVFTQHGALRLIIQL